MDTLLVLCVRLLGGGSGRSQVGGMPALAVGITILVLRRLASLINYYYLIIKIVIENHLNKNNDSNELPIPKIL